MGQGWQVGRVFGIPLYIDRSWFLVILLFAFLNGSDWQDTYPQWGALVWLMGLVVSLLLFASVLLHELGHSLVARSQGITVRSITLFLFGGVAAIERESNTPAQAFQVAIAGPLVSFALFVLLQGGAVLLPGDSPLHELLRYLANINFVLGVFNLLPGLPLDGGQVLKAAVWKLTGNRFQGMRWAARSGQLLGWLAISFGLFVTLLGTGNGLWLGLLGWFALQNATLYNRLSQLQEALVTLTAADAMTRDFRVIEGTLSLREFADRYLLLADRQPIAYFVATDGRYCGYLDPQALNHVERSRWEVTPVAELAVPLRAIATVKESDSLAKTVCTLEEQQQRFITVLTPADAVAGVIDRGDVLLALAQRLHWQLAKQDIQRLKQEKHYPPELQLLELARTALQFQGSNSGTILSSQSR
ncbi:MAG: site-2 protease family protein [Thermosynechococcus sp.]|uniref:site-2 protease family protein n=1 Tax=Thermosynechococcus sp. TaxID=2814275 RepID=UPI0022087023|nr:site-2 protease family protein [Thermosynechococcus sp.]BCX13019.1 MAG: site-2 protease family protein [Thermosynechococcus sp.]